MSLEFMALSWLRFEKKCPAAMYERCPRYYLGQPDVLGITANKYLLEIEIKRSVSDFRANAKKPHIALRDAPNATDVDRARWPKQFWYLVPHELVDRIAPEVPEWAGLLRGPTSKECRQIYSVIKAPANKSSLPLNDEEMSRLYHNMANHIYSNELKLNRGMEAWIWNSQDHGANEIEYLI